MKRTHGTITELPDGRFWARAPRQTDGARPSLGIFATDDEAERALTIGLHALAKSKRIGVQTFADFARDILDEREHNGIRGIAAERLRFSKHLASAHFAGKPLDAIKPPDVAEWLRAMGRKKADDKRGDRHISAQTIRRALSLACVIFDAAGPQERGLVESNPCLGLKVKAKTLRTEELFTWLTLEEQRTIATSRAISDADRRAILFAIGTGLRQGEQFNLELRDVHVDGDEPHIVVRYGSKGKAPKNGKIRTVPLFGYGLEAARAQLAAVKGCPNPYRILFPAIRGGRRGQKPLGNGRFLPAAEGATHVIASGKPKRAKGAVVATHAYTDRFADVLAGIGIVRNVRWHDLRHTCASSLIQGLWGAPWSLEEVRDMLGHSSIIVTQKYAHLGVTALKRAAKKVDDVGYALVTGGGRGADPMAAIVNDIGGVGSPGLEPGTYGLKVRGLAEELRDLTPKNGAYNPLVTQLAATLATLLEAQS